ncbi:MAG TPA: hypothetical protein VH476_04745 [Solirubrobacterales bacterium]
MAPFALDANEGSSDVEGQVIPTVLGQRFQDVDSKLRGFLGNRQFGDVPLVISALHEHMFAQPVSPINAHMQEN